MALVDTRDRLVVFARYPTPGRVKTRLAARLGDEAAARLYDAFVRDLVGRFSGAAVEVRWAVAPPDPGFAERYGLPAEACFEQEGDDLGARMRDAFRRELGDGEGRCVLVGSDAPHLSSPRVADAFERLSSSDVVLGPALDGGYYLIGMRQPHDLFSGVVWSTASVCRETEDRAGRLGLSVARLEPDFDVDEVEDLDRLGEVLRAGGVRCPATERVLREVARP